MSIIFRDTLIETINIMKTDLDIPWDTSEWVISVNDVTEHTWISRFHQAVKHRLTNPVKISDSVRQSNSDANLCENAHSVRKMHLWLNQQRMTEGQLNNCNEHSTLDEQAGQRPLQNSLYTNCKVSKGNMSVILTKPWRPVSY